MRSSGDNSYIYSSGCKLEDDEVTVMKFTNDSRLNQLDLKQIDGLQPQDSVGTLNSGSQSDSNRDFTKNIDEFSQESSYDLRSGEVNNELQCLCMDSLFVIFLFRLETV